jgi:hypothetical protein
MFECWGPMIFRICLLRKSNRAAIARVRMRLKAIDRDQKVVEIGIQGTLVGRLASQTKLIRDRPGIQFHLTRQSEDRKSLTYICRVH